MENKVQFDTKTMDENVRDNDSMTLDDNNEKEEWKIIYASQNSKYSEEQFLDGKVKDEVYNIYTLTRKQASLCGLITTTLGSAKETFIKVYRESVTPYAMEIIMNYIIHHNGRQIKLTPAPIRFTDMNKLWEIPEDITLINSIHEKGKKENKYCDFLFDVMKGASYLDVIPLVHLISVYIAASCKGKSTTELDELLGPDPVEIKPDN